jgi:hypothetical protein
LAVILRPDERRAGIVSGPAGLTSIVAKAA